MRKLLYGLLFVLAAPLTAAEYYYTFDAGAREIYDDLMALELDLAQAGLENLRRSAPRNLASDHLESYLDFFRIYLSGDESLDGQLEQRFDARIDRLEAGDETSPHYRSVLAEVRLHRSLVDIRFERQLAAFRQLNRAHKLLRDNARRFPDHLLTYKNLGLLHAAVGSIPPKIKWGVELFSSLSGTVAQGRREMRRAMTDRDSPFYTEITALYALMELYLADRPLLAYRTVQNLGLNPRGNALHCFVAAIVAMRNGKNGEVIRLLEAQPRGGTTADFPYLDFLLGQAKLRNLDVRARVHYQSFLVRYRGRHFHDEALQKIAWTYLLEGNVSGYRATMARIGGGSAAGGDESAVREAALAQPPQVDLLRARLLFDGGAYARARTVLDAINTARLSGDELLEYHYRRGRVLGGLGEIDGAIALYRQTIVAGRNRPAFYACNAALQAGLLEEARDRPAAAREFFESCLEMEPDEYRTSLHAQAKAGLDRLR